jgi:Predicted glycosyltransferases
VSIAKDGGKLGYAKGHRERLNSFSTPSEPGNRAPLGIVTVTYSPGEYLGRFIDSIPTAVSQKARVVLADNGSTDGVPEHTAQQYEWVEFLDTGGTLAMAAA